MSGNFLVDKRNFEGLSKDKVMPICGVGDFVVTVCGNHNNNNNNNNNNISLFATSAADREKKKVITQKVQKNYNSSLQSL